MQPIFSLLLFIYLLFAIFDPGNRKENVALLIEHGAKINDYLASNYELLIAQALQKYTKTHGTEETDVESNVNASCDEVNFAVICNYIYK